MATYGPHDLAIPEYPTAADGPSAFQQFAASVEKGLYGIAVDEADRDTRYADIPVGGLVTSYELRTIWMRVETGWHVIVGDRVVTTGYNVASSWDLYQFEASVENERIVTVALQLYRTGNAITAPNNGNIANVVIGILPSGTRPGRSVATTFRSTSSSGGVQIQASGHVVICDMNSNSTIATDDYVHIDSTHRLAGA